jgi:hypothetical protein
MSLLGNVAQIFAAQEMSVSKMSGQKATNLLQL